MAFHEYIWSFGNAAVFRLSPSFPSFRFISRGKSRPTSRRPVGNGSSSDQESVSRFVRRLSPDALTRREHDDEEVPFARLRAKSRRAGGREREEFASHSSHLRSRLLFHGRSVGTGRGRARNPSLADCGRTNVSSNIVVVPTKLAVSRRFILGVDYRTTAENS